MVGLSSCCWGCLTPSSQTPNLIEIGFSFRKWIPNRVRKTPPAAHTKFDRPVFALLGLITPSSRGDLLLKCSIFKVNVGSNITPSSTPTIVPEALVVVNQLFLKKVMADRGCFMGVVLVPLSVAFWYHDSGHLLHMCDLLKLQLCTSSSSYRQLIHRTGIPNVSAPPLTLGPATPREGLQCFLIDAAKMKAS